MRKPLLRRKDSRQRFYIRNDEGDDTCIYLVRYTHGDGAYHSAISSRVASRLRKFAKGGWIRWTWKSESNGMTILPIRDDWDGTTCPCPRCAWLDEDTITIYSIWQ